MNTNMRGVLLMGLGRHEIKNLFAPCGTVVDVEIIKHKGGKNRNFAFVTMASPEEAQAAVNQFDTQEVSGRIIRVEFAKKFKKPRPQRSASAPARETQHKLYVSNLSWKVRSTHLREFFSANFNPVSSKVVFESNEGRSAGYGFVSFATKEEAEAAISSLDGKEPLGSVTLLAFWVTCPLTFSARTLLDSANRDAGLINDFIAPPTGVDGATTSFEIRLTAPSKSDTKQSTIRSKTINLISLHKFVSIESNTMKNLVIVTVEVKQFAAIAVIGEASSSKRQWSRCSRLRRRVAVAAMAWLCAVASVQRWLGFARLHRCSDGLALRGCIGDCWKLLCEVASPICWLLLHAIAV
ncbi:putative chloroplast RNA binding protein [Citrus sinensis]|nr:putative chloroplast RNA binding protein [Citrus sinensis]